MIQGALLDNNLTMPEAWGRKQEELVDRSALPRDSSTRRPSHADSVKEVTKSADNCSNLNPADVSLCRMILCSHNPLYPNYNRQSKKRKRNRMYRS
jgi:hypothetical protein